MRSLRIGLAQINTTIGDLAGNTAKVCQYIEQARSLGVDLLCFPELAITGYPPEDLLLKPSFIADNIKHLDEVVCASRGLTVVVGFVDMQDDIYNAAAVAHDGRLLGVYHKMYLPNYGVFDENRYFLEGRRCPVFLIGGIGIGVNVCEDIWYASGPANAQVAHGAEVIVNISASPFYAGKREARTQMLATRASDHAVVVAYVNAVGGQDELVFDGHSMLFDQTGHLIAQGSQFREGLTVADVDIEDVFRTRLHDPRRRKETLPGEFERLVEQVVAERPSSGPKPTLPEASVQLYDQIGEIYQALVLGTRDYVLKNRFEKVLVGLSGGIDSSLTAAIAVDALGSENVVGVSMPSRYTSAASKDDAQALAENLGFRLLTIPIESIFAATLGALAEAFRGTEPNVTEENLQARIRGNLLMALSNKFGYLVLTTGNKSEMATGYATLYGDMAGGFAVIKDVPKTMVYQLAEYRNRLAGTEVIPNGVLVKEPTAELRHGQRDQDTLPPYAVLDPILKAYVEEDRSYDEMVSKGFPREVVERVITMVDHSEYKRRQAPPGVKITPRAFGRDRRLPITNRYRAF
ncbi:MAG: NAD+ synthase [Chloroflexi bacterium]|nr:NAD+ synthase [Chloroflexota bacterium]